MLDATYRVQLSGLDESCLPTVRAAITSAILRAIDELRDGEPWSVAVTHTDATGTYQRATAH